MDASGARRWNSYRLLRNYSRHNNLQGGLMSLNGYSQTNGTIKPKADFDDESAAIELETAMRGFGCDRRRVMRVLTGICNAQRQLIRTPYNKKYSKDLYNELKRELSGDFEEVILGLMETPTKYDAYQLHRAVAGVGTAKSVVVEILSSRCNDELRHVKNEYKTQYGRPLDRDISDDTSGEFREILLTLLQCKRDEGHMIDNAKAREEARALASGDRQRIRTTFKSALTSENPQQLCKLFAEYRNETGRAIEDAIEEYFAGDAMELLLALAQCAQNKTAFFANLLYNSMKGVGTRDRDLIRLIVSRSEIDLALVREEFGRLYKKPLTRWIEGECSGAYRDSLIAIVNGN